MLALTSTPDGLATFAVVVTILVGLVTIWSLGIRPMMKAVGRLLDQLEENTRDTKDNRKRLREVRQRLTALERGINGKE